MRKKEVSEFFHSYSADFDAIYGGKNTFLNRLVNRFFRKSMRLRYVKTIEGCSPIEGKTVIDIGCGPGHYGITLAKRGAKRVVGLDFAEGMLELARKRAAEAGVADRCEFVMGDFRQYAPPVPFDYAIVMGFMDYIADPRDVVEKVRSMTRCKAFFSFPAAGGFLAWQRKLRYRKRCDLFMYTESQVRDLFSGLNHHGIDVERIKRDFFVTVRME